MWVSISICSLTLWLGHSCLKIRYWSLHIGLFLLHPLRSFPGSCLETCNWLSCSNKTVGQYLPCDLTGVNVDWVLCCTSALVGDGSNFLWNLFAFLMHSLCNHSSFSSNAPTVLAAGTDKSNSSLASSVTCPLLSKVVGPYLFVLLCFEELLSLPSLTLLIFGVFIPLFALSPSVILLVLLEDVDFCLYILQILYEKEM